MSLYGEDEQYLFGAIENALLVLRDWKGWTLRVYHDDTVPASYLDMLATLQVELFFTEYSTDEADHAGLFWRFYVLNDPDVCRFIIRDPDSRLTSRDRMAVQEWIESGELFHNIRDHPHHGIAIMGAMWGAVGGFIEPEMMREFQNRRSETRFNDDQLFLKEFVWPNVKDYALVHDSYFCRREDILAKTMRPMPTRRLHGYDFVGNAYRQSNGYSGLEITEPCPIECRKNVNWTIC